MDGSIRLYLSAVIGHLGNFISTIATTLAMALPVAMTEDNIIGTIFDKDEVIWFPWISTTAEIVGLVATMFTADYLGRQKTILYLGGPPLAVSFLLLALAQNVWFYYIAVFLAGFGHACTVTVFCIYIGEISTDSKRGMLISLRGPVNIAGTLWLLALSYVSWFWFNIITMIVTIVYLILFYLFAPESQHFYVHNRKFFEAKKTLRVLRRNENVTEEFNKIIENAKESSDNTNVKAFENLKIVVLIITLFIFQELYLKGFDFNKTVIYTVTDNVVVSDDSIVLLLIEFTAAVIGLIAVEFLGRRRMLLVSLLGILGSEILMFAMFYLESNLAEVIIVCLVFDAISYGLGFITIPWVLIGEIFPYRIRAKASAGCLLVSLVFERIFIISSVQEIVNVTAPYGVFIFFNITCLFIVYFFLKETAGKSFDEINRSFRKTSE